jgi:hypothetical protein
MAVLRKDVSELLDALDAAAKEAKEQPPPSNQPEENQRD